MTDTPTSNTSTLWHERDAHDHVVVAQAENDFGRVQQSLSTPDKIASRDSDSVDLEKGRDHRETFDLREYLTSSNDANSAAGIKHKHVGVTWEELEVSGIGGEENKVSSSSGVIIFSVSWPASARSTSPHTQVSDFPSFLHHFLTLRADAVTELITFPFTVLRNVLQPILPKRLLRPPPVRTIIHKFVSWTERVSSYSNVLPRNSGVLRPGEMILVLGAPGAGTTTFLKVVANERGSYFNVAGDVRYAGISHSEMLKHYNGEVVYNQEGRDGGAPRSGTLLTCPADDIHIPTLTVGQTLDFALSTKAPGSGGRLPGVSKQEFSAEVRDLLLRMLNISHTKSTLVGNEFVRGVSGGERKRVSIAEMMATRARVQSWDNSTRGLDASTALDFVKGLRIMTDVLGQTTFVSLYQAGEGIYDLFDKVMVLDHGRRSTSARLRKLGLTSKTWDSSPFLVRARPTTWSGARTPTNDNSPPENHPSMSHPLRKP